MFLCIRLISGSFFGSASFTVIFFYIYIQQFICFCRTFFIVFLLSLIQVVPTKRSHFKFSQILDLLLQFWKRFGEFLQTYKKTFMETLKFNSCQISLLYYQGKSCVQHKITEYVTIGLMIRKTIKFKKLLRFKYSRKNQNV